MEHRLPNELLERAIDIHVVGCGGTGSQLIPGLVALHKTLVALGHPAGLNVVVWDADDVAAHNCIRQNFFTVDVGRNKAEVMVNRINIAHADAGVHWYAVPVLFSKQTFERDDHADFVIGCVDSTRARAAIREVVTSQGKPCYWLDCGNSADSGQFVAGQWHPDPYANAERLPLVSELFPEIVSGVEEDDQPSCSAIQSIQRQGVVTNRFAATMCLTWLDEALRRGTVNWCGSFFNLRAGRVNPIPVDPSAWASMGFQPPTPKIAPKAAKQRKGKKA